MNFLQKKRITTLPYTSLSNNLNEILELLPERCFFRPCTGWNKRRRRVDIESIIKTYRNIREQLEESTSVESDISNCKNVSDKKNCCEQLTYIDLDGKPCSDFNCDDDDGFYLFHPCIAPKIKAASPLNPWRCAEVKHEGPCNDSTAQIDGRQCSWQHDEKGCKPVKEFD